MLRFKKLALASALVAIAYPAQAGEITGNGKDIKSTARSECAFSGINDSPGWRPTRSWLENSVLWISWCGH